MYPVTCLEYTEYPGTSACLKNVDTSGVITKYIDNKIGPCNRTPVAHNMRLKLPFTTPIITYDSCCVNELTSLIHRHLLTNDHLSNDSSQEHLWKNTFDHYVKVRQPRQLNTYTLEQVYQSKRGPKRKVYLAALKSLRVRPLNKNDSKIKMFIKNERMAIADPPKPPRAIQSRSPRYNMVYQTYILPYSERWKTRDLNKRICTKGLDQFQIAERLHNAWRKYRDPVAVLLDHKWYDSKQHKLPIKYCNDYISLHFVGSGYDELANERYHNHCFTKNGIRYFVKFTRLSGEADTSDGNSTVNDMMIRYITRFIQCDHILIGDDSVIICESDDLDKIRFDVLDMYGFMTKINIVHNFEDIDYCQCKPVLTVNGWLMVRDPLRVMSRGTVCINHSITTIKDFMRWCRGVGECEFAVNAGVPILQSFGNFMRAMTLDKPIYDDKYIVPIERVLSREIIADARISFYHAFGISPKQQEDIEHYFDNFNHIILSKKFVTEPSIPTCASIDST